MKKALMLLGIGGVASFLLISVSEAAYPCETHARMQPSRTSPEWFTRGVVYQFKPANFTPEGAELWGQTPRGVSVSR